MDEPWFFARIRAASCDAVDMALSSLRAWVGGEPTWSAEPAWSASVGGRRERRRAVGR